MKSFDTHYYMGNTIYQLRATCYGISQKGNGCSHLPKEPEQYEPPNNHKKRPYLVQNAIDSMKKAYFYPKRILTRLSTGIDKKSRVKRSERREMMLHSLDLLTFKFGFFTLMGNL